MQREYSKVRALFAKHFTPVVWQHVQILLMGAILARSQRTVSAVLRVMGLSDEQHFVNYHLVLNRAVWSSLAISQTLLQLLVQVFVPSGPFLIGGDETIQRRRGAQIKAKGIYRDPVRSRHSHFVKASELRWLTLMLLVPIPFAERVWALPFLTLFSTVHAVLSRQVTPRQDLDGLDAPGPVAGVALVAQPPDHLCG